MDMLLRTCLVALLTLAGMSVQAGALQLVTEDDPPHNMLRDGKIVGIAADKLDEAFRRAEVEKQVELLPWARAFQSAQTKPGHCAFSAARTLERETQFKWIGPVAAMDWVLYARADGTVQKPASLDDVRRETIGGYLQDVISVWLAEQGYRVETVPNDSVNPRKLLAGRINYWASSRPRATAMLARERLSGRIMPVLTFGHTDLYLACHKSTPDELVDKLNQALRRMRDDGTSALIEARYALWPN